MPSIDKLYLYKNYSRLKNIELNRRIDKSNKKLLIRKKLDFVPENHKQIQITQIKGFEKNLIKRWFISFVSVVSKKGCLEKYRNYIFLVFKRLNKNFNLFEFFFMLEKKLSITFESFKKKIAGRHFLIPIGLDPYKRINAITRLVISSLKLRKERKFVDKLYNELLDIINNQGFSINRRLTYTKQLKDILTNIRFLNEKYI
uniref:Ribosomal protein S7 n=1 Tax=Paramoeba aparasomata TaxID=2583407 RepID=A0A5P8HBJ1_9EUKA|nr:ribosomal protein S7 [Paramoeba aparasomata]